MLMKVCVAHWAWGVWREEEARVVLTPGAHVS